MPVDDELLGESANPWTLRLGRLLPRRLPKQQGRSGNQRDEEPSQYQRIQRPAEAADA